jgi:biopolymer transport protein ExbD
MAMTGGKMGDMKSDINITPLVDVVLVLLIIFMVVTPLLQRGYETKVPPKVKTTEVLPQMSDQIVVRLSEDGGLFINRDQYTESEFSAKLEEVTRGRENKVIFFAADGNLPYDKVARFMDMCDEAGAKNLGIVLDDLSSTPTTAGATPQ